MIQRCQKANQAHQLWSKQYQDKIARKSIFDDANVTYA